MDVEMDIDIELNQDSPNHILNALNDYCLQQILKHMETRYDILNAAKTCTRFQANIISCFQHKCKEVEIRNNTEMFDAFNLNCIALHEVYNILSVFGPTIEKLYWMATRNPTKDNETLKTIARFCGRTLVDLHIRDYVSHIRKRLRFTALQILNLENASCNFKIHSQLKYLEICQTLYEPLGIRIAESLGRQFRNFPKLEHLVLRNVDALIRRKFKQFVSLNPQLKKLTISGCKQLTSTIFVDIAKRLPNIEGFNFQPYLRCSQPLNDDVQHLGRLHNLTDLQLTDIEEFSFLGQLDNLKHLKFSEFEEDKFVELAHVLAKKEVTVEHLSISLARCQSLEFVNVPKMKSLKRFTISKLSSVGILNLVKTQTTLNEINLEYSGEDVSMDVIKEVFSIGKYLTELSLCTSSLDFALDKRVFVIANGRFIEVDVPFPRREQREKYPEFTGHGKFIFTSRSIKH